MNEIDDDPPDFTHEQLNRTLKEIGEKARREAFAAGLPVTIFKNGNVVLQYADGHEEIAPPREAERQKVMLMTITTRAPEDCSMQDMVDDPPEFTTQQLRQALKEIREEVRREHFAAGLPVIYLRDGFIIREFADGREACVSVEDLDDERKANGKGNSQVLDEDDDPD